MHLSGVLVTHHHPDHVGGSMMGFELKGLAELLERVSVPVHVNALEADWVSRVTGIARSELTAHEHGDVDQRRRHRDRAAAHSRPHTRQPVLPAGRPVGRGRHAVPGRLRPHRFPRWQRRRHVSQPAGARTVAWRSHGVSWALVFGRAERFTVGGAPDELRVPGKQSGSVAHVDGRLTAPRRRCFARVKVAQASWTCAILPR